MAKVKNGATLAEMQTPEISSLNGADLDVEQLESRLDIASMVPNADCWMHGCKCYDPNCGINACL